MKEKRLYGVIPLREAVRFYAEEVVKTGNNFEHLKKVGLWDLLDLDYYSASWRGRGFRYPRIWGYHIYDFRFGGEALGYDYKYTGQEPLGYEKKT